MEGKQYVYVVQRRDYEDHTDGEGRLSIIEVHANLEGANAAAKEHLEEELENAPEWAEPEIDQDKNRDGGLRATCHTQEDERDHFELEVIKMELKGASIATGSAPKAGKATPAGKPDALSGLSVVFTGTFNIDRETCVATAKKYGATVQTAPNSETDYVFLGAQAGQQKLQLIEKHDLETLGENGFLALLKDGVPQEKRDRMAAKADGQRSNKRQKT